MTELVLLIKGIELGRIRRRGVFSPKIIVEAKDLDYHKFLMTDLKPTRQTDGYAGYSAVSAESGIKRLACMAQLKCKFMEAKDTVPGIAEPAR